MNGVYWAFTGASDRLYPFGSDADDGPEMGAAELPDIAQLPRSKTEINGTSYPCVLRADGTELVLAQDSDDGLRPVPRLPPVPSVGLTDKDAEARKLHGPLSTLAAYQRYITMMEG